VSERRRGREGRGMEGGRTRGKGGPIRAPRKRQIKGNWARKREKKERKRDEVGGPDEKRGGKLSRGKKDY